MNCGHWQALLHVTPLAYLLAATVSAANLLLTHDIPAAHVTDEHNFLTDHTSIFPFFDMLLSGI